MAKKIIRIVLTGGPAAGKTTLISRILKEFKQNDGWKVLTVAETATDLISGLGIGPFPGCMSMEEFQYFVFSDQFHKEELALRAAYTVPQEKVLIIYDRALFDNLGYVGMDDFRKTLAFYGRSPENVLAGYDAVLHLVSCAKGAEYAYNYGNAARYESVEVARKVDDTIIEAWSAHPHHYIIDNSVDFEYKINQAIAKIYEVIGEPIPATRKRKYLIQMPDLNALERAYYPAAHEMEQIYLADSIPNSERRIRKVTGDGNTFYFYTEKRTSEDGKKWVTERPISETDYRRYLLEADSALCPVRKTKLRFTCNDCCNEIDIYPFCKDKAILFVYGSDSEAILPDEVHVLQDVTGDPEYKNRELARRQTL